MNGNAEIYTLAAPVQVGVGDDGTLLMASPVVRGSDGALIPPDPANSDWLAYKAWTESGKEAAPIPATVFDVVAIGTECQRRIYAVASQNCQMNMTAYVASGQASDADRSAFNDALAWVQAMRTAHAALAAARDASFAQDAHWPVCPPDAVAMAARF